MHICRFCLKRVSVQTYDSQAFIDDVLDHLARCVPDHGFQTSEEEWMSGGQPIPLTWPGPNSVSGAERADPRFRTSRTP